MIKSDANVCAVDVGVGHDDDAGIAQIFFAIMRQRPAADRLHQIGELRVGGQLVLAGGRDVEDFSAQGQDRLGLAIARRLALPPAELPSTIKSSEAFGGGVGAIGKLAGKAEFLHRGLA